MSPPPESHSDLTPDVRDAVLQSRKQFVAAAGAVRPRLHRFCARMCGSSVDGEDLVQEIVGAAEGIMSGLGATYSTNYTALKWEWRLSPGVVDGVPVIVHWRRDGNTWRPHAAIRLWWQDGAVVRIRDYIHVDYLLTDWFRSLSSPAVMTPGQLTAS